MRELLNTEQAAGLLGVKRWTLRAWVSQRKVPFVKLGRLVRFDPAALELFVLQNSIESIDYKRLPRK